MKPLTPLSLVLIMSLFVIMLFSCRSGVKEDVYENPEAGHKILITGATSEFKKRVVEGIVGRYKEDCQIEIMPPSRLEDMDYDDYSAIIIMDQCQAWMAFNVSTLGLVRKIKGREKVILFITAGNPDWRYSYEGIDAITSASEEGKETEVIERISARIDALIG